MVSNAHTGTIDDRGFAAILESDDLGREFAGIIGGPRVNPTRAGLWIEDSFPALIDQITIAVLEDFLRREAVDAPVVTLGQADAGAAANARALCNAA